jgi:hypothetical protein
LIPSDTVTASNGTIYVTSASGRQVALNSNGGSYVNKPAIPSKPRNTITSSFAFSQVINKRLQGAVLLDLVFQKGDLGLPFHRVYWNDDTVDAENLPS